MAWNPSPTVAIARDAAGKLGANRIVCLYTTDDGQIGYVSYGRDRRLCDEARKLAGRMYETAMGHCEAEGLG